MMCEGMKLTERQFNEAIKARGHEVLQGLDTAQHMGGATYYTIHMARAFKAAQEIVLLFENHWAYNAEAGTVACPCKEIAEKENNQ